MPARSSVEEVEQANRQLAVASGIQPIVDSQSLHNALEPVQVSKYRRSCTIIAEAAIAWHTMTVHTCIQDCTCIASCLHDATYTSSRPQFYNCEETLSGRFSCLLKHPILAECAGLGDSLQQGVRP